MPYDLQYLITNHPVVAVSLVALVVSLLSVGVSIFSAITTHKQAKTNNTKLKLDLYNRRYLIYEKTSHFYHAFTMQMDYTKGDAPKEIIANFNNRSVEFVSALSESVFLFGKNSEVHRILTELKEVIDLRVKLNKANASEPKNSPSIISLNEKKDNSPEPGELITKLYNALTPWLDFHTIESPKNLK